MINLTIQKQIKNPQKLISFITTCTSCLLLLIGSTLQFPIFLSLLDGIYYSSSMFLVGFALTFFQKLAETISSCCCIQIGLTERINLSVKLLGWFVVLVGSVLGSPLFDFRNQKDLLYLIGFTTLFLSKTLEIILFFLKSSLPFVGLINKHFNIFMLSIFALLFTFFQIIGTMVFMQTNYKPSLILLAVPFQVFGAFILFASNLFLYQIYFGQQSLTTLLMESKTQNQQQVPSSELNQIKIISHNSIIGQQQQE